MVLSRSILVVYWLCLINACLTLNATGQKTNSEYKILNYYGSRDKGKT